jgi:hypothetical protein
MQALQNPKLMQGLMGAVQLKAKVQQNLETGVQKVAKRFSLATEAEVRELRRLVRKLERELEAQKASRHHDATATHGPR